MLVNGNNGKKLSTSNFESDCRDDGGVEEVT